MPDFIELYSNVLSAELCDSLIETFNASSHQVNGAVAGRVQPREASIKELHLNHHQEYSGVLGEIINKLVPVLAQYYAKYYQAMLAGTSLTVYHPKTKQPVKLTSDNFEEVGVPQVEIMMKQLFRLGQIRLQKSEVTNGVTTIFHNESHPVKGTDEVLHRMLNFTVFLNDVEEGGETEFSEYARKVNPKKGSLLVFPAYFTHAFRQNKPLSNDKYQLHSWVMFNRSDVIYGKK